MESTNQMDITEGLQQLPSLKSWTQGGPAQYATSMKVPARRWFDSETWEVEEIARPENNPWLARTRVTGMDFLAHWRFTGSLHLGW